MGESKSTGPSIRIIRLTDSGDSRGSSFTVPPSCLEFLGAIQDLHIADICPGALRGNHYHQDRRELLCIRHTDRWSLYWDLGPDSEVHTESFSGSGVVLVEIEPSASHAVRNDGSSIVYMVGFSDLPFNPSQPDSYPRRVV